MWQITKLIRQIRDTLAARGGGAPAEALATEYARLSHEANARLESCAAMLEKGSEYQALQLAEAEPVLLDLLAALSFAEARVWAAFCETQRLATPARFDAQAVMALDAVYAKGIRADHPLYRDYRAAVSSRDDTRAIQIVRSIVRLNAQDANANAELARLENKLFQLRLQSLRTVLAKGAELAILAELAELERLATPAKLAEFSEFAQASEVRRIAARAEAIPLAEHLAHSLEHEHAAGAWRMVGELLARIRSLQNEHEFSVSPEAAALVAEMDDYFQKEKAAADAQSRFQEATRDASRLADEVDERLREPAPLKVAEADALCREFARRWQIVESHARPVTEELGSRVRDVAKSLNDRIASLQRRHRARLGSAIAVSLAFMVVVAWFAVREFSARHYARQLDAMHASGTVSATEELSARLHHSRQSLDEVPELKRHLDDAESWTRDQRQKLADADRALTDLEKSAAANFSEAAPAAAHARLETLGHDVDALAHDLREVPSRRLAAVRDRFATFLASAKEKWTADAEMEIAALEKLAAEKLGYEQTQPTILAAVEEIGPRLKKFEPGAQSLAALLELSPTLSDRLAAVHRRFAVFEDELALIHKIHEELLQATTMQAYELALAGFRESKLPQLAEVNAARKMIAAFPKTEDALASLLLPGNTAGWASAKAETASWQFVPDNVLPAEIGRLLGLRDDTYSSDIWELTVIDYTRKSERRAVFSRGEMRVDGPREVSTGQTTTWTGAIFDPSLKGDVPAFMPATLTSQRSTFGIGGSGEVADSHPSAVSQCLTHLELNRMTDAKGEKFERPLLRVFDDLVHDKSASPLFKAFLMQQLGTMLRERPAAWGLHYCPRLTRDLARLDELTGGETLRSMDWLLERKRAQFAAKLTPFFTELQSRSYFAEARFSREVVRAAIKAGIAFGGFIDGEGRPHFLGEAAANGVLWAIPASGGAPVRCEKDAGNCARFSPVFYVPLDRSALLVDIAGKLGIKPVPPEMPLFAAP